jgi:hypothetical protein
MLGCLSCFKMVISLLISCSVMSCPSIYFIATSRPVLMFLPL